MYKLCPKCGMIHDYNKTCYRNERRQRPVQSKVRYTAKWKRKSEQIKERDKYLCQYCLKENRFNYRQLEVHHIIPLVEDESKAFDDDNLITLCNEHHRLAEEGKITKEELRKITPPCDG